MTCAHLTHSPGAVLRQKRDRLRVLLVDTHALARAGLRSLLQTLDRTEVVAEARDGHEALHLAQVRRPDLVIIDLAANGLRITARLKQLLPKSHIIVLSLHESEEYALRALEAGASAYVLKNSAIKELGPALQAIVRGETYLSPPVSSRVCAV